MSSTVCRVCGTDAEGAFAPSQLAMVSSKNGRAYIRKSALCRSCASARYWGWYQANRATVIARVIAARRKVTL